MKSLFTLLFLITSANAAIIKTSDFPTVQSAIDAAKAGDTVSFTAKNYGIVPALNLKSGVKYLGNGANLQSPSSGPIFPFNSLHDIEISGFTLVGNGMSGVSLANASIHDNVFNLGSNGLGIYVWVSAPADGCKTNPAQCNAVMPITATNVVIERNDFYGTANYTGQNEGIHVRFDTPAPPGPDNGPGKSTGFIFRNNRLRNISRCGGEFQGGSTGSVFEDNLFVSPTFSPNQSVNSGSMGLSLAMDASHGTIARRNKIDGAPSRTVDGVGLRNGIEGSGHAYLAQDNYVWNSNNAADINNGQDMPTIRDNNMGGNASDAVPANMGGRPYLITNNGPSVKLTWDISRAWPISSVAPPACPADSPDNLMIDSSKALCLGGTQIGILSGHISINGVADNATSGLVGVLLYGKKIYQKTAAQFWLASVNPPTIGTSYSVASDPRPVCVPKVCEPCIPISCN